VLRLWMCLALLGFWTVLGAQNKVVENGGYEYEVGPAQKVFSQHEIASSWPESYQTEAPYRIWLLDNQRRFGVGSYADYVFEARNPSMLQDVANYSIEFAPSWQKLVIHELSVWRDGRWQDRNTPGSVTLSRRESGFEQGIYDGQVSALIVFKDVAVDEPMRVRYSVLGEHPLLQGLVGARFALAWETPILERRISAHLQATSADAKPALLHYRWSGREADFQVSKDALRASDQSVELVLKELPIVRRIDMLPRDQEAYPMLAIAPKQSWSDVQARARSWFDGAFAAPSDAVRALADRLKAEAADKASYTVKALRHVQDDVRYFAVLIDQSTHRPHPPSEVIERAYGDCKDKSQLLTALLRANDIDAVPALAGVSRQKSLAKDLPDVGNFDHAIVLARIDGKDYWLDPTITNQGGDLDSQATIDYGYALPVVSAKGAEPLMAMRPAQRSGPTAATVENYRVDDSGQTALEIESTYRSEAAEDMRARIATQGKRTVAASYKEYYERIFGKSQNDALKIQDERSKNQLLVSEAYRFDKLWQHEDGERFADVTAQMARYSLQLPDVIDRSIGLRFSHPVHSLERLRFALPKDAKFVNVPNDVRIEDPAFVYERKVKQLSQVAPSAGLELEITHSLQSRAEAVATDALAEHLERRRDALNALSVRVRWQGKNPGTVDSAKDKAQRQERYRRLLDRLEAEQ
jgi:hypothetical protein